MVYKCDGRRPANFVDTLPGAALVAHPLGHLAVMTESWLYAAGARTLSKDLAMDKKTLEARIRARHLL
jgi:hypothetical protein